MTLPPYTSTRAGLTRGWPESTAGTKRGTLGCTRDHGQLSRIRRAGHGRACERSRAKQRLTAQREPSNRCACLVAYLSTHKAPSFGRRAGSLTRSWSTSATSDTSPANGRGSTSLAGHRGHCPCGEYLRIGVPAYTRQAPGASRPPASRFAPLSSAAAPRPPSLSGSWRLREVRRNRHTVCPRLPSAETYTGPKEIVAAMSI
jgi:hypothetical protein